MKFHWIVVFVFVASLLLAACKPAQPPSLDGSAWILNELEGQAALSDPLVTLQFSSGQVNGSDGCNRYGGSFVVDGSRMTIGPDIFSTMMACEEATMQQAATFLSALVATFNFKVEGDQLSLLDDSQVVRAVFTRQSQDLTGTSWIVTGYNNGAQAVVSPLLETELSLTFDAGGKLNGNACNSFFGSVETAGGTIKISQMGRTEMYCTTPEGSMEQEDQFLAALASAATYRVDGNILEMRTATDEIAVTLTRKP